MAVTKIWPVTHSLKKVIDYAENPEKTSREYQSLQDVLQYAKNEEKTEREYFCSGINCNPSTARDQFITVKEQYGKTDGIQAYHGYLSFKEENITPELAQKIGEEFVTKVWGDRFQAVVTTHLNTHHLHCHFVVNSVSFRDGKRLHDEKGWVVFRHVVDELCKKYGLEYKENPNRSKRSSYYYRQELAGIPTRYSVVRDAIDEALSISTSLQEFDYNLSRMGYTHCLSESRKYWTIVPKNWKKPIRMLNLGEDYTNTRILERLDENRGKVIFKPFQPAKGNQYKLPTRYDKLCKLSGLRKTYFIFMYKIGVFPQYRIRNTRVNFIYREEWNQLDELSKEVRLISREKISDTADLFRYKTSLDSEYRELYSARNVLRNEIRHVNVTGMDLAVKKIRISEISKRLGTLRNELKLCDKIEKRCGVIEEQMNDHATEEKKKEVKKRE